MPEIPNEVPSKSDDDRREFLKSCGRFAIVTPPAVTMLLSTSHLELKFTTLYAWPLHWRLRHGKC
ncbi:hypothetical protein GOC67_31990, partial [Sinorhizobium medicae]|nr:hypothetical protein [Sinorhizobium medicae]MDX0500977.1 hypothetical protein [Sinorhizobium medicae]MDX0803500.1 hypothetical protein [Sinorhizobium medicae]MDX1177349.1 hypothetical protein [Sinorhizobium medicae]